MKRQVEDTDKCRLDLESQELLTKILWCFQNINKNMPEHLHEGTSIIIVYITANKHISFRKLSLSYQ